MSFRARGVSGAKFVPRITCGRSGKEGQRGNLKAALGAICRGTGRLGCMYLAPINVMMLHVKVVNDH